MQTTVTVNGRTYVIPLHPSTGVFLAFRAWVAEQERGVFEDAEAIIKLLPQTPEGQAEALDTVRDLRERRKQLHGLGPKTPLFLEYAEKGLGMLKLSELIVQEAYPDLSGAELAAVLAAYAETATPPGGAEGNGQAPALTTAGAKDLDLLS